jgi:hypothetical protein
MQWSKRGAHLLLRTRVKTLTRELGPMFKRWYPDMEVEELPAAASSPASPCSRCFSKTTQMHDIVIGLFVNRYTFGRAV